MYEDDLEYASRRLNNTLVRTADGNPFYVLNTYIDEDGKMYHKGEDMLTHERRRELHSTLNLEPVPLGFINTNTEMVFIARKPMRRDWRQGLSHNSIITFGRLRPEEVNFKLLVQPIFKQYPSFAKAIAGLAKKRSVAFSRDFGVVNRDGVTELFYRQYLVGQVKDNIPVLFDNKMFLQQHLVEAMA